MSLGLALLAAGCTAPLDPNMELDDSGQVDFTQYAGVSIVGIVSENGAPAEPKKLRLDKIAVALYTKCVDQFAEENEPVLMGFCTDASGAANECRTRFCNSMAYNCLAQELLTAAESTGPIEFETEIYEYESYLGGEEIHFTIYENRTEDASTSEPTIFSYRIPPLTAEQRSLLYVAARAAAREAGIRATEIATESPTESPTSRGDTFTCLEEIAA
jgi:hypothetical protein